MPTLTVISAELVGVCDTSRGVRYHYELVASEREDGIAVISLAPCTSIRPVKKTVRFENYDGLASTMNGWRIVDRAEHEGDVMKVELAPGYEFEALRGCLNTWLRLEYNKLTTSK